MLPIGVDCCIPLFGNLGLPDMFDYLRFLIVTLERIMSLALYVASIKCSMEVACFILVHRTSCRIVHTLDCFDSGAQFIFLRAQLAGNVQTKTIWCAKILLNATPSQLRNGIRYCNQVINPRRKFLESVFSISSDPVLYCCISSVDVAAPLIIYPKRSYCEY